MTRALYRNVWATSILFLAFLAALMLVPNPSQAAKGFYLGTGAGMAFPNQDGDLIDDLDPGVGLNLELIHLGYNFTDRWGIGLQYGAASGFADDELGDDTQWGEGYLTLSGRYTYDTGDEITPYFELGIGTYDYIAIGDDAVFASDPTTGLRLAVGAQFYLNRFYMAPELSYHFVDYSDEGEVELEDPLYIGGPDEFDVDFDARGDLLVLQFKIGYHWKQRE